MPFKRNMLKLYTVSTKNAPQECFEIFKVSKLCTVTI